MINKIWVSRTLIMTAMEPAYFKFIKARITVIMVSVIIVVAVIIIAFISDAIGKGDYSFEIGHRYEANDV